MIDTETNWVDEVMSVGVVLADAASLLPLASRYYIFPREAEVGGMYESSLYADTACAPLHLSRKEALADIGAFLNEAGVDEVFAYNARFDAGHLPELDGFFWYDIMRLASYRQYNRFIPETAELCSTGRLRRGFGVERILRMLAGECSYAETHNAVRDAEDELTIMRLLALPLTEYRIALIRGKNRA